MIDCASVLILSCKLVFDILAVFIQKMHNPSGTNLGEHVHVVWLAMCLMVRLV